jgi:hypothetical protein
MMVVMMVMMVMMMRRRRMMMVEVMRAVSEYVWLDGCCTCVLSHLLDLHIRED